jgi:hypothetical protein
MAQTSESKMEESKSGKSWDEASIVKSGENCWESRWQRNAVPELCKNESCVMGIGKSSNAHIMIDA